MSDKRVYRRIGSFLRWREAADEIKDAAETLVATGLDKKFKIFPAPVRMKDANGHIFWNIQVLDVEATAAANENANPEATTGESEAKFNRLRDSGAFKKPGRKAAQYVAFDESHTLQEWSKISGIAYRTLYARIKNGLSLEDALTRAKYQRDS